MRHRPAIIHSFVVFLLINIVFGHAFSAQAQTPYGLNIQSIEVIQEDERLVLNVYFTVFDTISGTVINNARIASAELNLVDENMDVPVLVKQPENPFYIVMLLDASGSMGSSAAAMHNAAIEAVKAPPENARFAVLSFNEEINALCNFLGVENTNLIEEAIRKAAPVPNAGTCLYDAVYEAVSQLEKAPAGRRSVILLTDGRDELANGDPCSKHSYEEVVQYATRGDVRVPVNIIGLAGQKNPLNSDEIRNLALSTGGISAIGGQDNLDAMFEQIMDSLKSQWLAQAVLYPTSGAHNAVLEITLDTGTIISEAITFSSNRDYIIPPDPVSVSLEGWALQEGDAAYQLDLALISPELVSQIKLAVWDTENGSKIYEQMVEEPTAQTQIEIPTGGLVNDHEYQLRISAFNQENQPFLTDQSEPVLITHDFLFSVSYLVVIDTVSFGFDESDYMLAGMLIEDPGKIARVEGWLIDQATNATVPQSNFSFQPPFPDNNLTIPMGGFPQGKYALVLRAFDANGALISATQYTDIAFFPTPPESLLSKSMRGIRQNPLVLVAIVGTIFLIIAYLVFTSFRNKRAAATTAIPIRMKDVKLNQALPIDRSLDNIIVAPHGVSTAIDLIVPPEEIPTKPGTNISTPVVKLTVIKSPDTRVIYRDVQLKKSRFSIGRERCDLNINDTSISGTHALIEYDPQRNVFRVEDVSRNGMRVNHVKIDKNVPIDLASHSILDVGPNTQVQFEIV